MSDENNIKVILVGMSGAGKTNIIKAIIDKPFEDNNDSTLTSSFVGKNIEINKINYQLEIWDTAGQEMYKSLTRLFIVDSKIVIFVYDITQIKSFEELDYWVKTVKDILGESPTYALFGNKKDLYLTEQVDENEAKKKAEEIGAFFRLTSAKCERENINIYLTELVNEYIKKNGKTGKLGKNAKDNKNREESFALRNKPEKQKKGCCDK